LGATNGLPSGSPEGSFIIQGMKISTADPPGGTMIPVKGIP
jgi:hypothetical protein